MGVCVLIKETHVNTVCCKWKLYAHPKNCVAVNRENPDNN